MANIDQWTENGYMLRPLKNKIQDFCSDGSAEKRAVVFQEFYQLFEMIKHSSFKNRYAGFSCGEYFEYVENSKRVVRQRVLDLMTSCQTLSWQGFVPNPNNPTTRKAARRRKVGDDTSLLHYAARIGDHKMFIYLIEKGADMDLRDSHGNLALDLLREIKPSKLLAILDAWQARVGMSGSSGVALPRGRGERNRATTDPSATPNPQFPRSDILMDLNVEEKKRDYGSIFSVIQKAKTFGLEVNLVMRDKGSTRQTLFERLLRMSTVVRNNGIVMKERPSFELLKNGCDGKCLAIDPCEYLLQDMYDSQNRMVIYNEEPIITLFETGASSLTPRTFQILSKLLATNIICWYSHYWKNLFAGIAEGRIPGLPDNFDLNFFFAAVRSHERFKNPNAFYKLFDRLRKTESCSPDSCTESECDIHRINKVWLTDSEKLNIYRILNGLNYHGKTLVLPKINFSSGYYWSDPFPWRSGEERTICYQLCTGTFQGALTPAIYHLLPVRMIETMTILTNIWWLESGDKASQEAKALARLSIEILFQIFNYLL